jgi:hypothetical protein
MVDGQAITKEYFIKRLLDLCLRSGLSGFPKDPVNQNILLKSALLSIGKAGIFTEKEINERLAYWITHISRIKNIDHVTLRRRLVDEGYLLRNNDGSCYRVSLTAPRPQFFEAAVDQADIREIIEAGREEIARRKREYMEKSTMRAMDR